MTNETLRDLLGAGYRTNDVEFASHMVEHMGLNRVPHGEASSRWTLQVRDIG